MKPEMKKLIIANLPYLLFVYLFGKLGQTYRLAAGADLSEKLLHLADGFSLAFESAAPSFHLFDLAVGVAGAVALRLMVYCKSKNAKKYRRGVEYGTLSTKAELEALHAVCQEYKMPLFLDGARLGYGLAAEGTDVTLADLARLTDVFYIGGTKVGALCGEAVVFPHGAPAHFMTMVKQRMS